MFLCNTGGDFEKKNEYLSVLMRNRVDGMYEDFPLRHVSGVNKPSIGRVEKRMPGSVYESRFTSYEENDGSCEQRRKSSVSA